MAKKNGGGKREIETDGDSPPLSECAAHFHFSAEDDVCYHMQLFPEVMAMRKTKAIMYSKQGRHVVFISSWPLFTIHTLVKSLGSRLTVTQQLMEWDVFSYS